jgi:hypothetical protein
LGIASILPGASINDSGVVAFSGTNSIFTADGANPVRTIRSGSFYDAGVQINNNKLLIGRNVIAAASQQFLQRFDTNQPVSPATTIAGVNGAGGINDFIDISSSSFGLNNNGQPVFSATALNGTDRQLVSGLRTAFNRQSLSTTTLSIRPVVADDGSVVLRAGNTNTSPIRLYNYALSTPIDIATVSSSTFSELGQSPGISDDGAVVVFFGVLNANPGPGQNPNFNQIIQTTAGPGIFASIMDGGTRRIIRIAGRWVEDVDQTARDASGNLDGICDPAEINRTPTRCIQGELGNTTAGTVNTPITFTSFSADSRIGVVHKSDELPVGIDNDTFIVAFLGTPSSASSAPQYFSNQLGLWTLRVDMKSENGTIREKPFRPTPVIQIGDNLGSATRQVTGISIYDPIALVATDDAGQSRLQYRPEHRLAFQASTVNGGSNETAIVRATYTDGDEDGLADHWERTGIDFNQDGTTDLALNMPLPGDPSGNGADPNRKDVFVEIDYMQSTALSRTHRPDYSPGTNTPLAVPTPPMTAVRNAFSAAPIRNINGTNGITLHNFVDEPVTEVPLLLFPQRGPNNDDDFDDFKFGSNGPTSGVPCGSNATDGHFGSSGDRTSGNCANILGAKRLVFRYALFAQTLPAYLTTTPSPNVYGRAEFMGNDIVIAFTVGTPAGNDVDDIDRALAAFWGTTFDYEYANRQAGVFMHELGHTLGLRHGGSEIGQNCKPNYLSIMNYARLSYYGGLSYGDPSLAVGARVRLNPAKSLDYARGPVLPTLTESSLIESSGIGGPSNEQTIYGITPIPSPLPSPLPFGFTTARISPANVPLDWNGNGTTDISPVLNMDVNRMIGGGCSTATPGETLTGYDDWSNLKYNFISTYNFTDSSARLTDIDGAEQTLQESMDGSLGSPDVDADGVSNFVDNCPFAPNTNQTDSNSNGIGDTCDSLTTMLADLSVTITESTDPVQINTPFDYFATVRNDGPNASQNVSLNYTLPTNVILNSVTPNQGSCSGSGSITCSLGTINSGSTATVTIRVTPTARGRLDSWIDAYSGGGSPTGDPNILNNRNSASTTVIDPSQTYTISGRVADASNIGIGNVFVIYSGASQGAAITDSNGDYSFSAISGGTYTLTPYKSGLGFSPQSRTVAYIDSNQVVSFTAAPATTITRNADFDGDGRTDASVFRPSDGNWYVSKSSDGALQVATWGLSTDELTPGDFDGDGKTDFAVYRPSNSGWYILQSSTGTVYSLTWGGSSDIPVAGDYDGDGKTDIAVWRPSDGNWYVYQSSNQSSMVVNYGQSGDIPVVGDFDGDRKTDFAFFRPNTTPDTATWNILKSTGGTVTRQFGLYDDKLVPADYDGDGSTDLGVWRPSSAGWYTAPLTEADPAHNFTGLYLGQSGDVPVPGDYTGDGIYDRAVFRNGTWYILDLTNNSISYQSLGLGTDTAIPNAYLPQ